MALNNTPNVTILRIQGFKMIIQRSDHIQVHIITQQHDMYQEQFFSTKTIIVVP